MNMKKNGLGLAGIALTAIGFIVQILSEAVAEKQIDALIDEKVDQKLSERNEHKES